MATADIPPTIRPMYSWRRVRPMTEVSDLFALSELPSTPVAPSTPADPFTYIVANYDLAALTRRFTLRLPIFYFTRNSYATIRYVDADMNIHRWMISGNSEEPRYTGQIIEPTRAALEIWADGSGLPVSAPEFFLPVGILELRVSVPQLAGSQFDTTLCVNSHVGDTPFSAFMTSCLV
jgi:hypothetical protein